MKKILALRKNYPPSLNLTPVPLCLSLSGMHWVYTHWGQILKDTQRKRHSLLLWRLSDCQPSPLSRKLDFLGWGFDSWRQKQVKKMEGEGDCSKQGLQGKVWRVEIGICCNWYCFRECSKGYQINVQHWFHRIQYPEVKEFLSQERGNMSSSVSLERFLVWYRSQIEEI